MIGYDKTYRSIRKISCETFNKGGMVWPNRFKVFCNHLVEEMFEDEWELYKTYRKAEDKLIYKMCYSSKEKDCVKHPTPLVPKPATREKIEL